MRNVLSVIILLGCFLYILSAAPITAAQEQEQFQPPSRDAQFEQEILERLAGISPEAVPIFQEATREMDAGQYAEAKAAYEEVLQLAPGFPDAERRLSYVEGWLGNAEAAVEHAQNALDADPSPYNHLVMAEALTPENPSPADLQSAYSHAKSAAEALPNDLQANSMLMWLAYVTENIEEARGATEKVLSLAPSFYGGHYFAGLLAAYDGKWEKAEEELLLSQELGMPAEDVEAVLDSGIRTQARVYRTLRWGGYTLTGWLVGFFILFIVGALLSRLTLRAIRQPRWATQFEIGRMEHLVRSLYRVLILVTSAYFYMSIPFLILLVIGGAGGLIYLFLVIGYVPIQLFFAVGIIALYSLYEVIRSIFTRVKEEEPGKILGQGETPALWSLTKEVAARIGTRPVDAIYITPAAVIAVTERGSLMKKLRGSGQRCLILGLGALNGMSQGQFKSILAHEYGHFINRDTAGGNTARQVQFSVYLMGMNLGRRGVASMLNPAWLFVNGFNRMFLRITLGASRLQEVLADRFAAITYGLQDFIAGLTHVVRQTILFNFQVDAEVQDALQAHRRLSNLYSLPPPPPGNAQSELEDKIAEQLKRSTGPYDSHLSLPDRIDLVKKAGVRPAWGEAGDLDAVWDLLPNPVAWQNEMTSIVQTNLDMQTRSNPEEQDGR